MKACSFACLLCTVGLSGSLVVDCGTISVPRYEAAYSAPVEAHGDSL